MAVILFDLRPTPVNW